MAYKKAEVVGPGQPFKMVTQEIPATPPGSVRIKVAFAGVCHSDVHLSIDGLGTIKAFGEDKFSGIVMGHEISGYVDEAGEDVDLSEFGLEQGDPVMVYPWIGCQNCNTCRAGNTNVCPDPNSHHYYIGCGPFGKGGYQTHLMTKGQFLLKVPDGIPMDLACMLPCSAGTSYAAMTKLTEAIQFQQNQGVKARLLVIGTGGLGLWCIILSKVMFGADKIHVIAADVEPSKLDIAKRFGADETVLWDPKADQDTTVEKTIKSGKIHAAVDLVTVESTSRIAIRSLETNGAVVFVGLKDGKFAANFGEIVFGQLTIRGCKIFPISQLKEVVHLVAENKLTYPAVEYYKLEEVYDVIEKLRAGKINGRAIIKH